MLANRAAGSPLSVLSGHEVVVDGMLLLGADGFVPGYGNVDPVRYTKLYAAAQEGRWEDARVLQDELTAGFEIVFQPKGRSGDAAGVGAFKTAMQALGVISSNRVAAPIKALESEAAEAVQRIVREIVAVPSAID